MLETILLVLLVAVLLAVVGGVFVIARLMRAEREARREDQSLLLLQSQLNELTRALDTKLGESQKILHEQFGASTRIIKEITEELTKVSEGQKQVVGVTDQLKHLQQILTNPKQRGVLGEYYLETVLKNVLPPGSYQIQYPFKNGEVVDAVIFYEGRIIPIDSKFSLENYNRLLEATSDADRKRYEDALRLDLKNRIEETAKYIRPSEDTMEFAFMFIPSEALYYDLLVNKVGAAERDLVSYAAGEKKVLVVSPTTLLAYLQTVIQGLRQVEINKSTERIVKNVGELMRHLKDFDSYLQKLGVQMNTTANTYEKAYKEFRKIDKDVLRITGESIGVEPLALERAEIRGENE